MMSLFLLFVMGVAVALLVLITKKETLSLPRKDVLAPAEKETRAHEQPQKQGSPFTALLARVPLLQKACARMDAALAVKKEQARMRTACMQELPEMLDIIVLGLSAGLSFDSSLALYTSRYSSALSGLLERVSWKWKLGLASRAQALDGCALRLDAPAFTRFSLAVTEALEFGMPLADALVRQAAEIRREQRLQIEEAIEKIPVKMLIPMGVFVVPAMLIAILGPLLSSALQVG